VGGARRGSLHHDRAGTDCTRARSADVSVARKAPRVGAGSPVASQMRLVGHGARTAMRAAHARRPRTRIGLLLLLRVDGNEKPEERGRIRGGSHCTRDDVRDGEVLRRDRGQRRGELTAKAKHGTSGGPMHASRRGGRGWF
jgi:hypothetical protein